MSNVKEWEQCIYVDVRDAKLFHVVNVVT